MIVLKGGLYLPQISRQCVHPTKSTLLSIFVPCDTFIKCNLRLHTQNSKSLRFSISFEYEAPQ